MWKLAGAIVAAVLSTATALTVVYSFSSSQTPERKKKKDTGSDETSQANTSDSSSQSMQNFNSEINDFVRQCCTQIDHRKPGKNNPDIYRAKTSVSYEDGEKPLKKIETAKGLGVFHEKVIMLLGATGSGKTTLINAMFNFLLGVKYEDDFRVKLVDEVTASSQAHSQTKTITAYTIHCHKWFAVPYTLTIVDTPGFGDTEGIHRDKEIMEHIRKFFETKGPYGIDRLDAVGFVVQSSLPRLTQTQRYIYDSILSLFGKDIGQNIFLLCTFSDNETPQVLSGILEANIPYSQYYVFNNGSLFKPNGIFDHHFMEMGGKNFKNFMKAISKAKPKSLTQTSIVLKFRHELESALQNIQQNICLGLNTIEELKKDRKALKKYKNDMEKNKDFIFEGIEQIVMKEETKCGTTAINCKNCNVTCFRTALLNRSEAVCLEAFIDDCCPACPRKCSQSDHRCENVHYSIKTRKVQRNSRDLQYKYKEALGKKMSVERAIQECANKIHQVEKETLQHVVTARSCDNGLNQIALKRNTASVEEYINLLIKAEELKRGDNLAERLEQLNKLKDKCKLEKSVLKQGTFNPFQGYNMTHEVEPAMGKASESGACFGIIKWSAK